MIRKLDLPGWWNKHERNRDFPLSPRWARANIIPWLSKSRSILKFRPWTQQGCGVMRVAGWDLWLQSRHPFDGCFLHGKIDFEKVAQAGWEEPR